MNNPLATVLGDTPLALIGRLVDNPAWLNAATWAHQAGIDQDIARQSLEHLLEWGVVAREKYPKTLLYRLNPEGRYAKALIRLGESFHSLLDEKPDPHPGGDVEREERWTSLTDEQIARKLAAHMGFQIRVGNDPDKLGWFDPKSEPWLEPFSPATNWDHAGTVIDYMERKHWRHLNIGLSGGDRYVQFGIGIGTAHWTPDDNLSTRDIALAALIWLDLREEGRKDARSMEEE